MESYLFLIFTVVLNSFSQILIKIGSGKVKKEHLKIGLKSILVFFNPLIFIALVLLFFATIFYLLALSKLNLSYAYPLLSSSYIFILLMSRLLLKEKVGLKRWVGVFIIIIGIFIIMYPAK
ncbi:MAG: EamA family transporter [bacterium]